jgi:hypothetical protein
MGIDMTSIPRYKRTVARITKETSWLLIEQEALVALSPVLCHGMDFFRVAGTGLLGDRLLRLIRVLEQDKQVASFWYLYRCNRKGVTEALNKTRLDLGDLRDFSDRLKTIRDRTFVHMDKAGVFDPQHVYNMAGITNSDVDKIIRALWNVMKDLFYATFNKTYRHNTYTGDDIPLLEKYRDDIAKQK